ncbi:MAG: AI-2E family transporter [Burkholderiales bacterium RIFCSPLOWO2_12_FULL_61_40]|nr:MAG: AI-2E family transporter [Burkholderiales bacterium RIFCSPLOWO2_12_FULL_61_40]
MNLSPENPHAYLENRALLLLLVAVTLALGWILLPFYGAILWGVIIALLFTPLYRRLLVRLKQRRTLAALLTLLFVLVIVVLPLALITATLAREAALVYEQLQSGELNPTLYFRGVFDTLPDWIGALLDRLGLANFSALQRRLSAALAQGTQFIATQALSIGQNTFEFVASVFITLYLAFFLIRDGDKVLGTMREAIPLANAHKQELLSKFTTVIRATVKGNLLVAVIQGALGGLAFWFLGVGGALLWAVLMAFLSLVPAVGAGLVWLPFALYFLMTGALWQGIALIAYGMLVIGLVDNLLRPILVGKDTRMPDYVVMITTLGGMAVFGINGFVLGPAIAAMFIAVWHIYASTRT